MSIVKLPSVTHWVKSLYYFYDDTIMILYLCTDHLVLSITTLYHIILPSVKDYYTMYYSVVTWLIGHAMIDWSIQTKYSKYNVHDLYITIMFRWSMK